MNEERTASQILCLETLVSFLLARESVHSGTPVDFMHEPMVLEFIGATQSVADLDPQGKTVPKLEAHLSETLDRVFLKARHMRESMHR